jgi:uncharacterized membrane protein YphA (DoxX/SURF4 family)
MISTNRAKITYWIFTVLLIVPMAGSGLGFITARPSVIEGMTHLGYPVYLIRFLGAAKLLGVLAVLAGTFPRIKEWAYAGFVFNLLGAFYSHLSSGDGPKALGPLVVLSFALLSYSYWRKTEVSAKQSMYQSAEESGAEVARAIL